MAIINKCLGCGRVFIPYNKRPQKFCTGKCYRLWWVRNNRDKYNANVRAYRARRYKKEGQWRDEGPKAKASKKWMLELKSNPCHDCGKRFPVCCMDFNHRIGTKKKYNIGSMFAHHYGKNLIKKELKKCDLVCANCHRIRTQKRRIGSGKYRENS